MIARFRVAIQFNVLVEANLDQIVGPEEIVVGNLQGLIYPPYQSQLEIGDASGESQTPLNEIPRRLDPADPQTPMPGGSIGNGPAIMGDAMRIDLSRDTFDRSPDSNDWNQIIATGFNLANSWLRRFKTLNRIAWARPLTKESTPWKVEILNDDGSSLEREEDKLRTMMAAGSQIRLAGLDNLSWNAITSLPFDYEPDPSDELLLDAYSLLPQVGPAIVLAHSAIETRVERTLNRLAVLTGQNPILWAWLTNRGGDHTKDPSTADQLDIVIKAIAGKSLKDEQQLWEKFQNLRNARNQFVHEGRAVIGRQSIPVDATKALELVQGAELIIGWLEDLLPQSERRPRFISPNQMTFATQLINVPVVDASSVATSGPEPEGDQDRDGSEPGGDTTN